MNGTTVAWVSMVAVMAVGCGPEFVASLERPIINGKACYAVESPSAVGVIFEAEVTSKASTRTIRALSCTGILIAPDTVLTAAHCINVTKELQGTATFSKEAYHISLERNLRDLSVPDPAQLLSRKPAKLPHDARQARTWVIHSSYSATGWKGGLAQWNDIGLIFLRRSVSSETPVTLITAAEASQIKKGTKVRIAGWGMTVASGTDKDGNPADESGGIKVCAETKITEVGKYELRIGSDSKSARKCYGDSGGPTYMDVSGGGNAERAVGITSHSYNKTGGCEDGGIDTRVDAYLAWIDKEMKAACASGDRDWCVVEGIPPVDFDYPTEGGDCSIGPNPALAPPWLLALLWLLISRRRRGGG